MKSAGVHATVTLFGQRHWAIRTQWYGWRRILGIAVTTNILAPCMSLFLFGWQIQMGRLPREVKTSEFCKWEESGSDD